MAYEYNPNAVLQTPKYGDLGNFKWAGPRVAGGDEPYMSDWNITNRWAVDFNTNQGKFTFIPEEVVNSGIVNAFTNQQRYFENFLNPGFMEQFSQVAQPVDLKGLVEPDRWETITNKRPTSKENSWLWSVADGYGYGFSGKGFLVPEQTVNQWESQRLLDTRGYDLGSKFGSVGIGKIKGIGQKDGQFVYVPEASGADDATAWITMGDENAIQTRWTTKKGGVFGDIARGIASIPFVAEIGGLLAAANPATAAYAPQVYAALKGVQGGVAGEDPLKVGLKAGATIGAASLLGGGTQEPAPISDATYATGAPVLEGVTGIVPDAGLLGGAQVFPVDVGAVQVSPIEPSVPGDLLSGADLVSDVGYVPSYGADLVSDVGYVPPYGPESVSDVGYVPPSTTEVPGVTTQPTYTYPGVEVASNFTPAPGSLQEALAGLGVETAATQAPFTAIPDSLTAATSGGLLGQMGAPITDISVPFDQAAYDEYAGISGALKGAGSLAGAATDTLLSGVKNDPLKALGAASMLSKPEQQGQPIGGGAGGGAGARGIDYSGLLALLQSRARVPGLLGVQFRPQATDLSQLYRNSLLG